MLATLFYVLGFLLSLEGLVTVLAGVVLFLMFPAIALVSRFKGFARVFLSLATVPLARAAVVISEHNDALFKTMRFDGLGVEKLSIGGVEKLAEDPDSALHYWRGIKFALVDEEHGVVFDPRHAAIGMRKRLADDHDEGEFLATTEEWKEFGVAKWKPGVFEMPNKHELVDLSAVQELIDGGERAEYGERVEEIFRKSQAVFDTGSSPISYLAPILAFIITFGGIWIGVWQFGSPGATDSVAFGAGLGILASLRSLVGGGGDRDGWRDQLLAAWARLKAVDWRLVVGVTLLAGTPTAAMAAGVYFLGSLLTMAITTGVLIGLGLLPLLTFIVRPSVRMSGALSKFWFRLGFLGYRQPVYEWTPAKYRVREYDHLDHTDDVWWYNLFGTVVGFTYKPGAESWAAEPMSADDIDAQQPVTDGGDPIPTNLPSKYVRSETIKRDDKGGYLPKRPSKNAYYIRSGIAMNRFSNSATGSKSLRKLLEAKQTHGGDATGLDEGTVFKTTLVSGFLGTVLGLAVFILPTFL